MKQPTNTESANPSQEGPRQDSMLELAKSGIIGAKNQLFRLMIDERLQQRHLLLANAATTAKVQADLANTQQNMKMIRASIEVLEEIVAEEESK